MNFVARKVLDEVPQNYLGGTPNRRANLLVEGVLMDGMLHRSGGHLFADFIGKPLETRGDGSGHGQPASLVDAWLQLGGQYIEFTHCRHGLISAVG